MSDYDIKNGDSYFKFHSYDILYTRMISSKMPHFTSNPSYFSYSSFFFSLKHSLPRPT